MTRLWITTSEIVVHSFAFDLISWNNNQKWHMWNNADRNMAQLENDGTNLTKKTKREQRRNEVQITGSDISDWSVVDWCCVSDPTIRDRTRNKKILPQLKFGGCGFGRRGEGGSLSQVHDGCLHPTSVCPHINSPPGRGGPVYCPMPWWTTLRIAFSLLVWHWPHSAAATKQNASHAVMREKESKVAERNESSRHGNANPCWETWF